jgi:hypothetical protein
MTEVKLNASYKDSRLNDIDVIETDIGKVCVMDKEVIFTNCEDGRFTVGVKLNARLRRVKHLEDGGMEATYLEPKLYGAFEELNTNDSISKITTAINTCIDNIIDGIKQMYAQPKEEA